MVQNTVTSNEDSSLIEEFQSKLPSVKKVKRALPKTAFEQAFIETVSKSSNATANVNSNDTTNNTTNIASVDVIGKVKKQQKPKEEPIDCEVCCLSTTKYRRKLIKCLYCDYNVCSECCQRYLLSKGDSHCMNCKKVWNKDFLRQHFTKTFIKGRLNDHYVDVLLELEKSLLPETVTHIELENNQRTLDHLERDLTGVMSNRGNVQYYITTYERYLRQPNCNVSNSSFCSWAPTNPDRFQSLEKLQDLFAAGMKMPIETILNYNNSGKDEQLHAINRLMFAREYAVNYYLRRYLFLPQELYDLHVQYMAFLEAKINEFFTFAEEFRARTKTFKPVRCGTEKCPGFLAPLSFTLTANDPNLVIAGECLVCNTVQCLQCMVFLASKDSSVLQAHNCDPNLVKTIKMIARNSKPCPNCKQPIEKNSGCDQMFCVNCHTAFDWNSNSIIKGRVHNPHYFEWLAKQSQAGEQASEPIQPQTEENQECHNNLLFTDATFNSLTSLFDSFILNFPRVSSRSITVPSDAIDVFMRYKEVIGMASALLSFWQVMTHFIGLTNATGTNVRSNPIERYRNFRKMFLRGKINEEQWKAYLKRSKRSDDLAIEKNQLLEATVLIGNQIFDNLIQTLTHLKNQLGDDETYLWQPLNYARSYKTLIKSSYDTTKVSEAVRQAYNQAIELCRYYNAHAKKQVEDEELKTYLKVFIPCPLVSKCYLLLGYNQGALYDWFLYRHETASQNELEFYIRQQEQVKQLLIDAGTGSYVPEETRECLETIGKSVEVANLDVDLTPYELTIKEQTERICKLMEPIVSKQKKVSFLLCTEEKVKKLVEEFIALMNDPGMTEVLKVYEAGRQDAKSSKSRLDVIVSLFRDMTNTLDSCMSYLFSQVNTLSREKAWRLHKEQVIKDLTSKRLTIKFTGSTTYETNVYLRRHLRRMERRVMEEYYNSFIAQQTYGLDIWTSEDIVNSHNSILVLLTSQEPSLKGQVDKKFTVDYSLATKAFETVKDRPRSNLGSLNKHEFIKPKLDFLSLRNLHVDEGTLLESLQHDAREALEPDTSPKRKSKRATNIDIKQAYSSIISELKYKSYFFGNFTTLLYCLEPSFGLHTTVSYKDMVVLLPVWCTFMLRLDTHLVLDWYKTSTLQSNRACFSPFNLMYTPQIFSCYINNHRVHPLEVIMLPIFFEGPLTMERLQLLEKRLYTYENIHCLTVRADQHGLKDVKGKNSFMEALSFSSIKTTALKRQILKAFKSFFAANDVVIERPIESQLEIHQGLRFMNLQKTFPTVLAMFEENNKS